MIPIYAKNQNGHSYSIYLDTDTMRVYRNDHQDFNHTKYWVVFYAAIILIRELTAFSLPDSLLVKGTLLIVVIPVSMLAGKVNYRKSLQNMREIYPTKDMLEDYIVRGKHLMRKELIMAGIILFISLFLCFLFIIFNWLTGLIFSLLAFAILGMLSNNISIKRWKLYKQGLNETRAKGDF